MTRPWLILPLLLSTCFALTTRADEAETLSVEQLVERHRTAVVVVTTTGRDGRREGLGSGFLIRPDGLIATNFHVIGEGRPIQIEMSDGKRYDVKTVVATDRAHDLALLQIAGKELPFLKLGDSDQLRDGEGVVALGNPQGLKNSVVSGIVSGKREIEGKQMIQLAIPLEPGNSGGPLLDRQGRVQGVLTLKSLVTANLGFAMPINRLKPLIDKPNPVPLEKWLTIGTLDPEQWKTYYDATWSQRAGRLKVEGTGSSFGGRALCISQNAPPKLPYEVAVSVKLDDERGAAGLIFHSDDQQHHYGFYPTNGGLRLTRFDGSDVFSWTILKQVTSPRYRAGEFNQLRVRLTDKGIQCFLNDELVIESDDVVHTSGQVGLAKFRDTHAEFKGFRVADKIGPQAVPADVQARIVKQLEALNLSEPLPAKLLPQIQREGPPGVDLLRERARLLEQQASQLRDLAAQVQQQRILDALSKELAQPEAKIDLIRAALLIAQLDNDEIDIDAYQHEVAQLGRKFKASLPEKADEATKLQVLNRFFFTERGFHGSRSDYYNRANSYLNEVFDDREGLPLTLSMLYLAIGRAGGLEMDGIGLPGHFVVRQKGGAFIDVFEQGTTFTEEEARDRLQERLGEVRDEFLEPMTKSAMLTRLLKNLFGIAQEQKDIDAGLRYLDALVTINPDAAPDRFLRAAFRFQKGRKADALADVDYLIDHPSEEVDARRLQQLRRALMQESPME